MSAVVTLTVPASGIGTPSDVSAFGGHKTIVCDGTMLPGEQLVVEVSVDPTPTLEAVRTYNGVLTIDSNFPGQITLDIVANTMRIRRLFPMGTSPSVTITGETGTQSFAALNVPTIIAPSGGVADGTPLDVSTFGPLISVAIGGTFIEGESVLLMGSLDNVIYDGIYAVNNGYAGLHTFSANYNWLKIRRSGRPSPFTLTAAVGGSLTSTVTPSPGTGVLQFDSINVVGSKLTAFATTGFPKGALAYVGNDTFAGQGSVHRYYSLVYGESLTNDGIEVVNSPTFGTDGAQWLSLDTVDQQAIQQRFWAIDETGGNDENTGWGVNQAAADLHPVKTMAELNRRLFGANYGNGVTVVIHQLTSITTGAILTNVKTQGGGYVLWLGTKTVVFSGAVTSFTASNPAGNTSALMAIASLPVGWVASGLIGDLIESADGVRVAFPTFEVSPKIARLTTPCASSSVTKTISTAASVFVPAETVNVCTLTQLPVWPFTDACQTAGLQYVRQTIGAGSAGRNGIGGTSTYITRCQLATEYRGNASIDGIRVSGCLIDVTAFSLLFSGGQWTTSFIGCLSTGVAGHGLILNGAAQWILNHGDLLFENASIILGGNSTLTTFAADSHLAAFNVTVGTIVDSADASSVARVVRHNNAAFIYGNGNTAAIARVFGGASMTLPAVANIPLATTNLLPLIVNGIGYPVAAMPIVDAGTLSGINAS